jgi:hypothetical protein
LGALFDSQDCTLWDFTLVYEVCVSDDSRQSASDRAALL